MMGNNNYIDKFLDDILEMKYESKKLFDVLDLI